MNAAQSMSRLVLLGVEAGCTSNSSYPNHCLCENGKLNLLRNRRERMHESGISKYPTPEL